MPQLKLTYFDLRNRGEPIRLILHYAGIQFEDNRIQPADWPSKKGLCPFGQIPLLEVDGKVLAQSWAIYRYVAKLANLTGGSQVEAGQLDQNAELFRDWLDQVTHFVRVKFGFLPGDAEAEYKSAYVPATESVFPLLERQLSQSGSGFFGKNLSWVDFVIADSVDFHATVFPEVVGKYTALIEHSKKIFALPQLQKYLSTRKPF